MTETTAALKTSAELYEKALELRMCAQSWEPQVKLLGNVSAQEINEILKDYLRLRLQTGIDDQCENSDKLTPLPCPFCGKTPDLEDPDTLYPSGSGWKFDEEFQIRTYHRMSEVPKDQWCWGMHCSITAGGCGAEIHADSKQEAIDKWNTRVSKSPQTPQD